MAGGFSVLVGVCVHARGYSECVSVHLCVRVPRVCAHMYPCVFAYEFSFGVTYVLLLV